MTRDRILLVIIAVLLVVGVGGFLYLNRDDGQSGFQSGGNGVSADNERAGRPVERAFGGGADNASGTSGTGDKPGPRADYAPKRSGIFGLVHEREGGPIVGAVVALCADVTDLAGAGRQGDILQFVETDPEGRFGFPGLTDTQSYIVRVDKEGYAGKYVSGIDLTPGDRKELDVVLDAGHALSGRVTDLSGAPIAGAVIEVRDLAVRVVDSRLAVERRATTGADGTFLVANVSPGFKDLSAAARGFATKTMNRIGINRATAEKAFDFELGPGSEIRGRVLDLNDQGIDGVEVRAQAYDPRGRRMGQFLPPVTTDANGSFVYDGLVVGDYILVAEKRGYYSTSMRDFGRAGSGDVILRLKRNPVIRGHVVDADSGAPVERFALYGTPRPSLLFVAEAAKQKFDSGDGSFEFLCSRNSGDLYLNVAADGYAGGQSIRIDLNGATEIEGIRIEADRGAQAEGRVVDSEGVGIPDAEVVFEAVLEGEDGLGGLGKMVYAQNRLLSRSAKTDENGAFEVDRLRLGSYRVGVHHPRFAVEFGRQVHELASPGRHTLPDIRLLSGGSLEGIVYETDDSPLQAAVVRLKPEDLTLEMPRGLEVESDADGRFKFEHIPAGPYRLEVIRTSALHHKLGGLPGAPDGKHLSVHVAEGQVEEIEVRGL